MSVCLPAPRTPVDSRADTALALSLRPVNHKESRMITAMSSPRIATMLLLSAAVFIGSTALVAAKNYRSTDVRSLHVSAQPQLLPAAPEQTVSFSDFQHEWSSRNPLAA